MLGVGEIAPSFSLDGLDGAPRSLQSYLTEGPALVIFFKISCETCHLTLPFLGRLQGSLPVVGVSQDDVSSTREFLDYFKITFPVVIDPAREHYAVSKAYQLNFVPSIFLIEKDGRISRALEGFHKGDLESLAEQLGATLFRPDETVPLLKPGCGSKN